MNILVVPSWYPSDENDIGGSFFQEQALSLQRAGHQVSVAYVETRSITKYLKDRKLGSWKPGQYLIKKPLNEYRWRIYNTLLKIPFGKEFLVYRKLVKLVNDVIHDQGHIDIIHLHSFLSHGYGAGRIASKLGIPLILTEHFTGFSRGVIRPYQKIIIKELLKNCIKITCVGPGLKEALSEYTNKKLILLPNMVDTSQYKIESKLVHNRGFHFLTVGILNPKKGIDLQIRALKMVTEEYPSIFLTIVGASGSQEKELKGLVESLGLMKNILFTGLLTRDKIPGMMASSNCFLLTSRHETFGVVLIEAMACGKPVIATNNPGPASIVTPETGILVENEDIQGIAEAMKKMIREYNSYEPEVIRQYCVDNFSQEAVTSRLIDIYKEVTCQP